MTLRTLEAIDTDIATIKAHNTEVAAQYAKYSKQDLYAEVNRRCRVNGLTEKSSKGDLLSALVDSITRASSRMRPLQREREKALYAK